MNNLITQEEINKIHDLCKQYNIENYSINADGSIDVNGSVDLRHKMLDHMPLKFNKISGNFLCHKNTLTDLVGCPKEVGLKFSCNTNNLNSLLGGPIKVGGNFWCEFNKLTSLEGCPSKVGQGFFCDFNSLVTLHYCPAEIGGSFYFYDKNNIAIKFTKLYKSLSTDDQKLVLKYQSYYDVWEPELNVDNMNLLIEDINDGLE